MNNNDDDDDNDDKEKVDLMLIEIQVISIEKIISKMAEQVCSEWIFIFKHFFPMIMSALSCCIWALISNVCIYLFCANITMPY